MKQWGKKRPEGGRCESQYECAALRMVWLRSWYERGVYLLTMASVARRGEGVSSKIKHVAFMSFLHMEVIRLNFGCLCCPRSVNALSAMHMSAISLHMHWGLELQ